MLDFLDKLPLSAVIFLCLTLGLAPFFPPHLFEKLRMLSRGELVRAIDWFDLLMHAAPWALLAVKLIMRSKRG